MASFATRSGFLRTRFARRTLLAFLGAALVPSALAAGIWLQRLHQTLDAAADAALSAGTRAASVALLERLDLQVRRVLGDDADGRLPAARLEVGDAADEATLWLRPVPRDGTRTGERIELTAGALWDALDQLVDGEESAYCVFVDQPLRRLHCSDGMPAALAASAAAVARSAADRRVLRTDGWRLAGRELFLRMQYEAPSWHLVVAHSDAPLAARLREEMRYLALIGLLALVSAFALSHIQLRRQTAPIEVLQRATRDVREGRLDTRVALRGDDEFTEFGETFNAMTRTLEQQFALLGDVDTLNQRALTAGSEAALVDAALDRLGRRTASRLVSVALLEADDDSRLRHRTRVGGTRSRLLDGHGSLSAPCRQLLLSGRPHVAGRDLLPRTSLIDPQLAAWQSPDIADVLVVPLRQESSLFGAVLVALGPDATRDRVAIDAERRLAERLALGLANVRLVARLDALALGTLRAFGSTIDANSRWTAGHSERVMRVAVQLGDELGISAAERLTLTRGCLLHDIGKVGIPAHILDKSERLSESEYAIVQRHPVIGARILGSIGAFRDLLPIVRSHHERFDGRGYPDGLAGHEIPWLARITAVADVFDALASARPYRAGLPLDAVRRMITDGSGSQFDPRVVEAFETLAHERRLRLPEAVDATNTGAAPHDDAPDLLADLFPALVP